MKLTRDILHTAGSSGVGFNFHQLFVLGVHWPAHKGWLSRLIGKEIPDDKWRLVMQLKGKKRSERRRLLDEFGIDYHHPPKPQEKTAWKINS